MGNGGAGGQEGKEFIKQNIIVVCICIMVSALLVWFPSKCHWLFKFAREEREERT